MMSKVWKFTLIFTILGFFAGMAVVPFQSSSIENILPEATEISILTMMFVTGIQVAVLSFIFSFLGLKISRGLNLHLYSPFTVKWVFISVFGGMAGMTIAVFFDIFVFLPQIPQLAEVEMTWWKGLVGGLLYGGIYEEVFLRLFLMSLIVWVCSKLTKGNELHGAHYWIGIILASLLFALGHLPAASALLGEITPIIFFRVLVMNSMLSLLFGYLYWKKGLIYSMMAHMASHIFLYAIVHGLIF
jgi:membrane protease YdiL (CAAX protease family)